MPRKPSVFSDFGGMMIVQYSRVPLVSRDVTADSPTPGPGN